jgi:tetratricopeptide (TPR) repeat protein
MSGLQPGQMLGLNQIVRQVGKGGMATVYKAYQAAMDRYVAEKLALADYDKAIELNPKLADTFFNRGLVNYDLGHYKLAAADFGQVIELNP